MSQSAALLVLVSAFLHAAWNGVIKRDEDSRSAGVAVLCVAVLLAVAVVPFANRTAFPTPFGLRWAIGAGLLEGAYVVTLGLALAGGPGPCSMQPGGSGHNLDRRRVAMIPHWEMILRITLAAFLGGVIGFERYIHRRQAGLRTHLIVAMASATFMVVSAHFMYFQRYVAGDLVSVDSSRIAASVVAGVGFLGGGSILRTGATVQGLTTAAGLWLVAAIGLCAGSGMYPESVAVTVLGLVALTVLRVFEDKKVIRRRITLLFDSASGSSSTLLAVIESEIGRLHAKALDLDYHLNAAHKQATISFDLLFPDSIDLGKLVASFEGFEGVREIQVRVP